MSHLHSTANYVHNYLSLISSTTLLPLLLSVLSVVLYLSINYYHYCCCRYHHQYHHHHHHHHHYIIHTIAVMITITFLSKRLLLLLLSALLSVSSAVSLSCLNGVWKGGCSVYAFIWHGCMWSVFFYFRYHLFFRSLASVPACLLSQILELTLGCSG